MAPNTITPFRTIVLVVATTGAVAFSINRFQTSESKMVPDRTYCPDMVERHLIRYDMLKHELARLTDQATAEPLVELSTSMKLAIRIKAPTPLELTPIEDTDGNL